MLTLAISAERLQLSIATFPESDKYIEKLQVWYAKVQSLADGTRPPAPPVPDIRRATELCARHNSVHRVATHYREMLHARWLNINDQRKAKLRAGYDAGRDWKDAQSSRSEDAAR